MGRILPDERCAGSLTVVPECKTDGAGIGTCPTCGRYVETTACPETDGRDRWIETHRPRLAFRVDPELAAVDRMARAEALATMSGEGEPW